MVIQDTLFRVNGYFPCSTFTIKQHLVSSVYTLIQFYTTAPFTVKMGLEMVLAMRGKAYVKRY